MYTVKPGFVYVIQMSRTNVNVYAPPPLIKVGETGLGMATLAARRTTLNTGNPYKLEYFARWKVTDAEEAETLAHQSLAHLKAYNDYGGGREWFSLPPDGYLGARKLIQEALQNQQGLLDSDISENL